MFTIRQKIVNELKSEINWRTFEVGYSEVRVPITNQFQVVMYLQAVINISFQVEFTLFKLYRHLFKMS